MDTEGLIIGLFCLLLFLLFLKVFIWPLYLKATYKGFNIVGEWEAYFLNSNNYSAIIVFKQTGSTITGVSKVIEDTQGKRVERSYQYNGTICSRSVALTYQNDSRTQVGAMTFWIADTDALAMKGTTTYYKPEEGKIKSHSAILIRKGSRIDIAAFREENDSDVVDKIESQVLDSFDKTELKNLLVEGKEKELIQLLKTRFINDNSKTNLLIQIERILYESLSEEITEESPLEERRARKARIVNSLTSMIDGIDEK